MEAWWRLLGRAAASLAGATNLLGSRAIYRTVTEHILCIIDLVVAETIQAYPV